VKTSASSGEAGSKAEAALACTLELGGIRGTTFIRKIYRGTGDLYTDRSFGKRELIANGNKRRAETRSGSQFLVMRGRFSLFERRRGEKTKCFLLRASGWKRISMFWNRRSKEKAILSAPEEN